MTASQDFLRTRFSGEGVELMARETMLSVAALLQAYANEDLVAIADLMDTMGPAERDRALRQSLRLLAGYIARAPGGMELWQRTWREMDGESQ